MPGHPPYFFLERETGRIDHYKQVGEVGVKMPSWAETEIRKGSRSGEPAGTEKSHGYAGKRSWAFVLLAACLSFSGILPIPPAAAGEQWWAFSPGAYGGYPWSVNPWVLFPGERPLPGYRFSMPPGAPLSYYDPANGTTYCWSRKGFYYACGYSPEAPYPSTPAYPPVSTPPFLGGQPTQPASGVLVFRLPSNARAAVDGVPIGLSEGLGIQAVSPGRHDVVLRIADQDFEHKVDVASHRIFMVTPAGILPTEP